MSQIGAAKIRITKRINTVNDALSQTNDIRANPFVIPATRKEANEYVQEKSEEVTRYIAKFEGFQENLTEAEEIIYEIFDELDDSTKKSQKTEVDDYVTKARTSNDEVKQAIVELNTRRAELETQVKVLNNATTMPQVPQISVSSQPPLSSFNTPIITSTPQHFSTAINLGPTQTGGTPATNFGIPPITSTATTTTSTPAWSTNIPSQASGEQTASQPLQTTQGNVYQAQPFNMVYGIQSSLPLLPIPTFSGQHWECVIRP